MNDMHRKALIILSVVFATVFVFSITTLGLNMYKQHKQAKQMEEILTIVSGKQTEKWAMTKENTSSGINIPGNTTKAANTQKALTALEVEEQLANYQKLKELNSDFVGWLKIEDTQIDYPVMQSKDRPNFYINHDFFKNTSSYGTLYVSEKCELFSTPSSNIIIYGHHMRDSEMLGVLGKYSDKSFYEEHKQIQFDTLSGLAAYEVLGFFEIDLLNDDFRYYDYVEGDEELFNLYVNNVKRRALYETETKPVYGRQLLTLTTCHYYRENVRLVLVAQRTK